MAQQIPKSLQDEVRSRAKELCEYCHTSERWQYTLFTIDHILPVSKGGLTLSNLALACFHCNRRKSDRVTVFDDITNENIAIFNPRKQIWREHFCWSNDFLTLLPLTDIGRVTITALALNRKRIQIIRAEDVAVKRHPPTEDFDTGGDS
jgi:hypothetical protein